MSVPRSVLDVFACAWVNHGNFQNVLPCAIINHRKNLNLIFSNLSYIVSSVARTQPEAHTHTHMPLAFRPNSQKGDTHSVRELGFFPSHVQFVLSVSLSLFVLAASKIAWNPTTTNCCLFALKQTSLIAIIVLGSTINDNVLFARLMLACPRSVFSSQPIHLVI